MVTTSGEKDDSHVLGMALVIVAEKGNEPCALELIKAGADVDRKNSKELTALMLACANGHERCVRALLEAGAAVEHTLPDGWTALIIACGNGHEQCARALLEAGAAVDAQLPSGSTALILACQNGHEQCALELIKAGAAVDKINTPRTVDTDLHHAHRHLSTVESLPAPCALPPTRIAKDRPMRPAPPPWLLSSAHLLFHTFAVPRVSYLIGDCWYKCRSCRSARPSTAPANGCAPKYYRCYSSSLWPPSRP